MPLSNWEQKNIDCVHENTLKLEICTLIHVESVKNVSGQAHTQIALSSYRISQNTLYS
jgi:hypothetical protein